MNWKESIEWLKEHNAEAAFQQIGQLDITAFWNGYYWSADGNYLELPKICEKLDRAIKLGKEIDGVIKNDYRTKF